ncbi:hypothetical protein KTH_39610 [Thermosporothrix hazakensis]|nr:hypothetical protein KTH_39610 [Thermosporothrix hazakensis]
MRDSPDRPTYKYIPTRETGKSNSPFAFQLMCYRHREREKEKQRLDSRKEVPETGGEAPERA